jgi:putative ATPase
MGQLFAQEKKKAPLAERLRPRTLNEFVGQEHIVGFGKPLRKMIESDQVRSLVLWGPPGTGKTTLGQIIAHAFQADFHHFSATRSSIKDIQAVMEHSRKKFKSYGTRDLIFVDELHRFNKAQQAAFLPYVEEGSVILIGATTENPSFEIINPLLSRSQVFVLKPLAQQEIKRILKRALIDKECGLGERSMKLAPEAEELIAEFCDGDARRALNLLELAADLTSEKAITLEIVEEAFQRKTPQYDKAGEEHYNTISALHKAVRNSEPDATLYWLARMLAAGDDPLYIARRLMRMAVEDIGLADPQALTLAVTAKDAYEFLGSPEGELALAEVALYLATAPKSNAIYQAFGQAREDVEKTRNEPVPLHIRNAVTRLMKDLDYSKGYQYAHNYEEAITEMNCMPENLKDRVYYRPTDRGFEAEIERRLERWKELRQRMRRPD